MNDISIEFIKDRLRQLTPCGRQLFAATIAERLFPLYELYVLNAEEGSTNRLRAALDKLWNNLSNGHEEIPNANEVLTLAPDEDADWTPLNPLAENAVDACVYACRSYLSDDPDAAAWAAVQGYEAVDYIAHTLNRIHFADSDAEQRIRESPIVREELCRQMRDIDDLGSLGVDDRRASDLARILRARAAHDGATLAEAASPLAA